MSTIEMFRKCSIRESESTLLHSSENEERSKYVYYIVSCERAKRNKPTPRPVRSDGTLLRAKMDLGTSSRVPVDFQGTDFDQTTTFYIEQTSKQRPIYTLKCYLAGQQYYLCAEDEKVDLLKTDTCDSSDWRFLFKIKKANEDTKFSIIKSLATRMYLVSDEDGNASMREIRRLHDGREPQDRQAWFDFKEADVLHMEPGSDTLTIMNEHMTLTENTCEVEVMRAKV